MVGCSRLVVLAAVAVLKEAKAVAADWVTSIQYQQRMSLWRVLTWKKVSNILNK